MPSSFLPPRDRLDDEEALAHGIEASERRARGAYYTPAALVDEVLSQAEAHTPAGLPQVVIDPACGAGAFLAAADARFPAGRLLGLELSTEAAALCRWRVPRAQVLEGDALGQGWETLTAALPPDAAELWVGNPPYNGTSPVLSDPARYRALRGLLGRGLPAGTSLRDDFAFFLLRAAARLTQRPGVLAFVTPASLLDGFLYAPLRAQLLDQLQLREVLDLGGGVFAGARVRTCVTVWSSKVATAPAPTYRAREVTGPFRREQLEAARELRPEAPQQLLRPPPADAVRLDALWRTEGEPLSRLIPVSFPGLKTRFDELLTDDDPARLWRRVTAFVSTPASRMEAFAREHGLPARCLPKLVALRSRLPNGHQLSRESLRPFWRYAGARHRGTLPEGARAFCFLDRALIPRGDHRLQGDYDPHSEPTKLIFNARELPLAAAVLEAPGCVHDHRHARFAPLFVPARVRDEGRAACRRTAPLGDLVPNLSARGEAWARANGGPATLFRAVERFINSPEVQQVWAPAFGTHAELPIPLSRLER